MRNTAGQIADSLHLDGLVQLAFDFALLGDILRGAYLAHDLAVFIQHRGGNLAHPAFAIRGGHAVFNLDRFACRDTFIFAPHFGAIIFVDQRQVIVQRRGAAQVFTHAQPVTAGMLLGAKDHPHLFKIKDIMPQLGQLRGMVKAALALRRFGQKPRLDIELAQHLLDQDQQAPNHQKSRRRVDIPTVAIVDIGHDLHRRIGPDTVGQDDHRIEVGQIKRGCHPDAQDDQRNPKPRTGQPDAPPGSHHRARRYQRNHQKRQIKGHHGAKGREIFQINPPLGYPSTQVCPVPATDQQLNFQAGSQLF